MKMKKNCGTCKYFKRERDWPGDGICLWGPAKVSSVMSIFIRRGYFDVTKRSGTSCKTWAKK